MSIFSVEGRVCCVTGAGRGIGNLMSKALFEHGAIVIGIDISFREDDVFFEKKIVIDLREEDQVIEAAREIGGDFQSLDVLVNCAGVTHPIDGEYPLEMWKDTFAVNVDGAFQISNKLLPLMEKSNSPSIINITSINESLGFPNNPAYVSSKSALSGLTKSLAVDHGPKNLRVNAIAPGYFKTDMTSDSWLDKEKRDSRSIRTALGRWGEIEELIGPLLFLASDASSYVSGHSLFVDGGWSIKGL